MQENIIPEKNKLGLATSMVVLHEIHDIYVENGVETPALAIETVLGFIDEVLLVCQKDAEGNDIE